jgi:hypothetical protein
MDNIKAGSDIHAGDGGYSIGTQEKYEEFAKARNRSSRINVLSARITDYLSMGGLFNPELADHLAVRDLLIECREVLNEREN